MEWYWWGKAEIDKNRSHANFTGIADVEHVHVMWGLGFIYCAQFVLWCFVLQLYIVQNILFLFRQIDISYQLLPLSASLPYASSARSTLSHLDASPSSAHSEDVTVGRVRRRSFQRAQMALKSASEQGSASSLASGSKPRVRVLIWGWAGTHLHYSNFISLGWVFEF
jgi:hypothetical protein